MKVIKGGRVSYDFEYGTITAENFHFDTEGGDARVEDILACLINAMRRELYKLNNKKDNPIKPEAADIKPVGWWAND